ncbi:MAG: FkbM family methyltransferase [Bacteroidales bacterium]
MAVICFKEQPVNLRSRLKALYKDIIFRMSANNNPLFIFYCKYIYRPRKGSIHEFTDFFSKSRKTITVVQIGANDGINNDPIHKFIKRDHWQGVLLEPQKYVFEKYLKPLYEKTPEIITINAALDKTDGYKPVYKISLSNSRWATGLASFNREVLEKSLRSGYIARQAMKEGCRIPKNSADCIIEERAECISPETLIKKYRLEKINWLQIDTEGYDYEIIKMFNPAETRPEVIVYENIHLSDNQKKECRELLEKLGYTCRDFGPNSLAILNPSDSLKNFFI